jgi:hypothetical protein
MKNVYLSAAIVGAVIPLVLFAEHFAANGYSVSTFVGAVFANPASSGFAADVLISSLVFLVWIGTRRPAGPALWPFVVLNCAIGLSCALPAYLYVCARRDFEVTAGVAAAG